MIDPVLTFKVAYSLKEFGYVILAGQYLVYDAKSARAAKAMAHEYLADTMPFGGWRICWVTPLTTKDTVAPIRALS